MKSASYLAALLLAAVTGCGASDDSASGSRGDTGSNGVTGNSASSDSSNSTSSSGNNASGTTGVPTTTGGILNTGTTPDELTKTSKVDLLFAIDNSLSMGDKQRILAQTVPDLIGRMATPDCIASDGSRVPSEVGGTCPNGGMLEFVPVTDIHIAVISSSLGAAGSSEICAEGGTNYNPTQEDMARLLTRSADGQVPTFQSLGFLAWDPDNDYGGESDLGALTTNFANLVTGVGEQGCGFEAQLESVYRFLMDPKPYLTLEPDSPDDADPPYVAVPTGVDQTILDQRKAFLRPDSLLAIFTITDENDCSVAVTQPGANSFVGTQFHVALESKPLWRASSQCNIDPNDPCCVSCGENVPSGCEVDCSDPVYSRAEDNINLRCFNQKKRFGVDMLYPVERYVQGVESQRLPNPDNPMDPEGVINPIYDDLTCDPGSAECKGPRDRRLIFWVGIVGVPWQDVAVDPNDFSQGLLAAEEFEAQGRWALMLGDPAQGTLPSDPFMIESSIPRSGSHPLTGDAVEPPSSAGAANAINGHEYNTGDGDLQYACIFALPEPRDCSTESNGACDCVDGQVTTLQEASNPLCQEAGSTAVDNLQRFAKAYPSTRILQVLKGLSQGAVVSSICPANLSDPTSPDYGYRPVIPPLMDKVKEIIVPK